jgi:hypothetical protein
MRQRIASDTTYTFADFKRNDQIDDFIVFTLAISIIIFTQTTPITSGLANIIIFLQNYNLQLTTLIFQTV